MRPVDRNNTNFGIFLAFGLMPISGLGTDIYLPSLPAMSTHFAVTASQVQLSITLFLIGYGLGQFFVGSIMDSFGRYWTGLTSLFLFGLLSLAIVFSPDQATVNLIRLLQGMLGAFVVVGKRAFFVDIYSGHQLRHYLSLFSVIWALGPILGPFVGGYLQTWFGWQASFVFLAAYAWLFVLFELWGGGESLQHFQRFHLGDIARRYREMLTHPAFLSGLIIVGLAYGTIMLFNLVGPFINEHTLLYSPVVAGYASLLMGLAWMTGGLLARAQLHRPLLQKHAKAILFVLIMIGAMSLSYPRWAGLFSLLAFAFCIHAGAGVVFNIYFAECLAMFPQNAALSGGLTGGAAFILTSASSYGVAALLPIRRAVVDQALAHASTCDALAAIYPPCEREID